MAPTQIPKANCTIWNPAANWPAAKHTTAADKHALFAELAALEDAFEGLAQKVCEAVWSIDEAADIR